jgi:RNase H-fold protein (predicted Holliday junction resolvase)
MIVNLLAIMKAKYTHTQISALADAFGKSIWTILRWIKAEDDRLTSDKAKKALKELKDLKK